MKSFMDQYTGFVSSEGYLVDRKHILEMYDLMKTSFPFVHSVIAMVVSTPRSRVDLSPFFDGDDDNGDEYDNGNDDNGDDHNDGNYDNEDDLFEYNIIDNSGVFDDTGRELLTKRERAVLEFFIAKIRVRSRKKMRFWAMVAPLGNHGRGHQR